jgi:hypothetical protein
MALVLSQLIVMGLSYLICKYSNVFFMQRTCVHHDATTMYYASIVDSDVDVFFLLIHTTKHFTRKNACPLVLFLSSKL